jgi:hypothetical protein
LARILQNMVYRSNVLYYSSAAQFPYTGSIVNWVVPATGFYLISARGAQGGPSNSGQGGGKGAFIQGVFNLTRNSVLSILVGERPAGGCCGGGGGGGGTFVALGSQYQSAAPLLVAGGGGGAYSGAVIGGQTTELGTGQYRLAAGCGAAAAPCGGGGGGFYTGQYLPKFTYDNLLRLLTITHPSAGNKDSSGLAGGNGFQQGGLGGPASGSQNKGGNLLPCKFSCFPKHE